VLVAFSLVVLTGVLGLSIDVGYLRYAKRRLQTAADSAAIAGASELQDGMAKAKAAALNDSAANGFQNAPPRVTVDAHPPTTAPFAGKADYLEVQVSQKAPTYFMRALGVNSTTLTATATAQLGSSKGCVYSLGLLGGINVNANVNAPNCGVVDNALLSIGGGCLTAQSIGVVLGLPGGCTNPPPVTGINPAADPLAYVVAPGVAGCNFTRRTVNNGNARLTTTLNPGVYCGGITVSNTNAGPVVFNPGLYILTGAPGLSLGGAGNISGGRVTFYVRGGASVQTQANTNITLTAPTTAPTAGIPAGVLFFQDPGDGQASVLNGALSLTGALYFPSAALTLGGNGATAYVILVAQTIQFNGPITIGTDYSSLTGGSPIKSAVLVE
jgi:hypothetical protein